MPLGAKHLSLVTMLGVLVFLVQTFPAVARASGPAFVDDFSRPSQAWREGNEVVSEKMHGDSRQGLWLGEENPNLAGEYAQVTLAGTTLNPQNMRTFTAALRWSFLGTGQPVLVAGWGKAREWDTIDECLIHLSVSSEGRLTVRAGKQILGEAQLAAPVNGVYELRFSQQPQSVIVQSVKGEVVFRLPNGLEARRGYFMLRADQLAKRRGGDLLRLRRVEIETEGDRAPLTGEERSREIQEWAKEREDRNWETLDRFKAKVESETAAGRWGYKTALEVRPGLIKTGEQVALEFHVEGSVPSPSEARVEPGFLGASPGATQMLKLEWRPDGHGGQEARVELTPQRPGNWRVTWQAGTERLSRTFAVVGPGYTVARLLITSDAGMWVPNHAPGAYEAIHEFGLAVDSWSADEWTSPFSRTPEDLLAHYGVFARGRHLWGDHVLPLANLNWFVADSPDTNLWRANDDVQREGIQQASRLWDVLGIGPMEVMGSYTFGHSTARIARSLGVKMLDSLCQWQDWRDGSSDNHWLINHVGVPALPYYVADDDFRKISPGRSIVAFTQSTNSDVRLYNMDAEGQPQTNFRRAHGEDMGESSNIDRFETVVDLWLTEALHQPEPLFVSVAFENFVDSPDWNEANKLGVHYLREKARSQKLVFASAADIAGYFERHYAAQPENWIVWPDTYAGQPDWYKPLQLPDRIEVSNAKFHTVHQDGFALPRYFWDNTRPWSEPVWDDQAATRQKYGLANPDLLTAENSVPRMVNLDGIRVQVEQHSHGSEVNVTVTVDASRAIATLPVAVWRVPFSPDGLTASVATRNARYLTVVDGSTGNAHGLLVCSNVPKGRSLWVVHLKGRPRQPLNPQVEIGAQVRGRMFLREGVPHTYLWLAEARTPSGVLKIWVPDGRVATVHYNDGKTEQGSGGELSVLLDRDWRRQSPLVTGLSAEEIMTGASFKALDSGISGGK